MMDYCEIEVMMSLKEPGEIVKMIRTLLKGRTLGKFEYQQCKSLNAEDIEIPDHELLEIVLIDLGLDYISRCTIRVQRYYMRRCLY